MPKIEGSYSLIPSASINTESLITAADYKEEFDLMVLTGYTFEGLQYFYTLENFVANGYDNLNLKRYLIPVKPAQIEAVKIINDTEFWITSESEAKGTPRLFHLKLKRPE